MQTSPVNNTKPLPATRMNRARAAVRVIRTAVGKTPQEQILFAVFTQAVSDVVMARENKTRRKKKTEMRGIEHQVDPGEVVASALIYLSAPIIPELDRLGVETEWAMNKLRAAGVWK